MKGTFSKIPLAKIQKKDFAHPRRIIIIWGVKIAMMYPQEVISEVKALNDIVDVVATYVKLTPRAGNHFGLCPFHSEKTPSFSVNRDKQIFYCFGCGAGGNVLSFVRRVENMDFLEALRLLADRVHFTLPQKGMDSSARKQAAATFRSEMVFAPFSLISLIPFSIMAVRRSP